MKSYFAVIFITFLLIPLNCCRGNVDKDRNNRAQNKKEYTLEDFAELAKLHIRLGKPKPGDWLYRFDEEGQSFTDYKASYPVRPNDSMNTIYILPLGNFSETEQNLIKNTVDYIGYFFMLKVKILDPVSDNIVPKNARRMNFGQEQLNSMYILDHVLIPNIPKDAICYISITNKDLYPADSWNFVFGQAYLTKRTGVSSFNRFFIDKLDSANYLRCLERTIKTTTHEICHMFSIRHCRIYRCLVNGSNSLEESDTKPLWLCPECLAKLQWCIRFDLIKRYDCLIDFFDGIKFEEEKAFYLKSKQLMNE